MSAEPSGERIEALILELCRERGVDKTICPSEVARALAEDDWRDFMPVVRDAAARLAADDRLSVTQRGEAVDPESARGPVRLGLPPDQGD